MSTSGIVTVAGVGDASTRGAASAASSVHSGLLASGTLAALHYFAMNVVVPMRWPGYRLTSQTVSELSAIGAPTRALWIALGAVFTVLFIAFGVGVILSAGGRRTLRVAGALIVAHGAIGAWWPPMHLRGDAFTLTDALHIVWSVAAVILMLGTIGFAAAGLGRRFRIYSAVTVVILLGFGLLTGLAGPRIAADLPTPWIGVWERISIASFFVWTIALSVIMVRSGRLHTTVKRVSPAPA